MSKLELQKEDIVDVVQDRVEDLREDGQLDLPPNYSVGNALKSAWLELQNTKTKNKKPALEACSNNSIANALLKMVVQGLNPAKKQGYFIAYGNHLEFQPSYFGAIKVCKSEAGAEDVKAQVIYKGDELDYEINNGEIKINKHNQKFENRLSGEIVGAYAVIEFEDERPNHTELMTIDQIQQAWKQGQTYKEGGNGTHQKFTEEMAKKTVINRACKKYINSSDDSNLVIDAFNSASSRKTEQEVEEEIEENANSEVIDIEQEEPEEKIDEAGEPIRKRQPGEDIPEDNEPEKEESQEKKTGKQEQMAMTGTEGPDF